jgi:thiol-disulfide isomerase/thioredoxin
MSAQVRFLNNKDFDIYGNIVDTDLVKNKSVILFFSEKCNACKSFTPIFNSLSRQNLKGVNVCAISVGENPELMDRIDKVFPFTVPYVPSVVSYDGRGYYSSYDYGMGEEANYRTLPDLIEYSQGIGKAPIQYK